MTRATALSGALLGVAAVVAGVTIAAPGDQPRRVDPALAAAKSMSLAELVGQRIVTGYVGTTPPKSMLRAVKLGRFGGVILFANNFSSPAGARRSLAKLQRAAKQGGQPRLLTMVDQEGGIVQRLPTLPPGKSPQQIGRSSDPAATGAREGRATGRALRKYGFNVNLAPVVDVPRVSNSFLGNRAYAHDSKIVADAGCAFAGGIERGGTAATFKHFPGLGRAGADTDFDDVKITATRAQVEADWTAYRKCPDTPSLVMIASARYPKLGINVPSSLTHKTFDLLATTGFKGLTITDAMETPQFGKSGSDARRALLAGVDIVLYGQAQSQATKSYRRVLRAAQSGDFARAELEADAARVIALKKRFGS